MRYVSCSTEEIGAETVKTDKDQLFIIFHFILQEQYVLTQEKYWARKKVQREC